MPRWPEVGYGYIERGAPLDGEAQCFRVASFLEKPNKENAARFAASGRHHWNSGMFLLHARAYLEELGRLPPLVVKACS